MPKRALAMFALVAASAIVLYPLAWICEVALNGEPTIGPGNHAWSSAAFTALAHGAFPRALMQSALVSLAATAIGLVFATTGAFALSRLDFAGKELTLRA